MTKKNIDPLNVNARLYNQVSKLLDDMEAPPPVRKKVGRLKKGEVAEPVEEPLTLRERIAALTAISRIQIGFVTLRAEGQDDEHERGSAVRKYAAAFQNAGGRRKARGAAAAAEPAGDDDFSGGDDPA